MLKAFSAQLASITHDRGGRRNLRVLVRFFLALAAMVTIYTVGFHALMLREGQQYSWITGFYWTLTVMSTLGFGDITFKTDVGRLFSILVLFSGTIFLLVLLPFTFIEFFYQPWIKAQAESRAPRHLPVETRGHLLLSNYDVVTSALIRRLEQFHYDYALVVENMEEALRLHDLGVNVMVGDFDDPKTWTRARVETAAMVVCTGSDVKNTGVAFTVRELASDVPIITSASDEASVDILGLAGSSFVLRLEQIIGSSFARRTLGGDAKTHVIGEFDELLIAEATAHQTPLVGKTLLENRLREKFGITVVGVWERGRFEPAGSETLIQENTVLVLTGTREHLDRYDEFFCIYNVSPAPVVILGGGRVGRATAAEFRDRGVDYRIVEILPERIGESDKYVLGSAADRAVLTQAGFDEATTVIVTSHDDDLNVYLTIYCRQLRPDIQILGRATHDRNVAALHRAGADSVLSYASIGAGAAMNMLQGNKIVMVAEGLDLFEVPVPKELAGSSIIDSMIRQQTGCSVVAIRTERGMEVDPSPTTELPAGGDIVLIGTAEAEQKLLQVYA